MALNDNEKCSGRDQAMIDKSRNIKECNPKYGSILEHNDANPAHQQPTGSGMQFSKKGPDWQLVLLSCPRNQMCVCGIHKTGFRTQKEKVCRFWLSIISLALLFRLSPI